LIKHKSVISVNVTNALDIQGEITLKNMKKKKTKKNTFSIVIQIEDAAIKSNY